MISLKSINNREKVDWNSYKIEELLDDLHVDVQLFGEVDGSDELEDENDKVCPLQVCHFSVENGGGIFLFD
jgi:hypothetical protein